jgi:hypothetical protein
LRRWGGGVPVTAIDGVWLDGGRFGEKKRRGRRRLSGAHSLATIGVIRRRGKERGRRGQSGRRGHGREAGGWRLEVTPTGGSHPSVRE